MLCGQFAKRAIGHAVEFHEHEVPDFDHTWVVFVDPIATGDGCTFGLVAQVDVDFGAGSTRTGIAHFPEIVFLVAIDDAVFRDQVQPDGACVVIGRKAIGLVATENGHVQAAFVEFIMLGKEFPRPFDGFFFEVIAKRPVAEHFEHGVVVGIDADFLEVIVFTGNTEALLRIGDARKLHRAVAKEDVFELVHSRIGKHQRWVVFHDHGCRWNDFMRL